MGKKKKLFDGQGVVEANCWYVKFTWEPTFELNMKVEAYMLILN